ncbi:MAG: hypothetical protein V1827_03710 [Candidatus Micrarchaeota archaeon]
MAFDIGKALKVGTIPIVILVVLSILTTVIGAIPFLNMLICILGLPVMLISFVVTAWAGYKAVKEAQMDLVGGALTGGLVSLISGVVGAIVSFIVSLLGIGVNVAGGGDVGGAAVTVGLNIVGIIVGIVFSVIIGLILGAIGAFVAGMKK